jgi:hypothetical protein
MVAPERAILDKNPYNNAHVEQASCMRENIIERTVQARADVNDLERSFIIIVDYV